GAGAGPQVRTLNVKPTIDKVSNPVELSSFNAFAANYAGGVVLGTSAGPPARAVPHATADTATVGEAATVSGNVLANDTGDLLTVSAVNGAAASVGTQITLASGGKLTVNANGTYTYNPTAAASRQALAVGESATDTFTYTVSDGKGGTSSATVTITVTGVNDA